MAASVFDSPLYAQLFPTGDVGRLFSDSAAVRAMLLVEGALAKAQGTLGTIPETSAAAIQRASLEVQIDPGVLTKSTGANGVCVPGLVEAFRKEMNAPEHAQYVHWGATSQDIIDTGLMLRLRQALGLMEPTLLAVLNGLADQAETYAETPMAARTYGQHATVTTWGAVLSQWGEPLLQAVRSLPDLRAENLMVSLSGAAGTSSALGQDPVALRNALAEGLNLQDPGRSWHTDRGPVLRIAAWMQQVCTALAAMAKSITALASSENGDVHLESTGASSTMPQKQNPVVPASVIAIATQTNALMAALGQSATHEHQRDGAAWFTEWMVLPQIVLGTSSALALSEALVIALTPNTQRMAETLDHSFGAIHAEALSFALCNKMKRPDAQRAVKEMAARSRQDRVPLQVIAQAEHPDLPADLFDHAAQSGQAPNDARQFVSAVRAL